MEGLRLFWIRAIWGWTAAVNADPHPCALLMETPLWG